MHAAADETHVIVSCPLVVCQNHFHTPLLTVNGSKKARKGNNPQNNRHNAERKTHVSHKLQQTEKVGVSLSLCKNIFVRFCIRCRTLVNYAQIVLIQFFGTDVVCRKLFNKNLLMTKAVIKYYTSLFLQSMVAINIKTITHAHTRARARTHTHTHTH